MSTPTPEIDFTARVRTMQIVVGALVVGIVVSLVVMGSTAWPPPEPAPSLSIISLAILFQVAVLLVLSRVVPKLVLGANRKRLVTDRTLDRSVLEMRLLAAKQNVLVMATAMCEGAAVMSGAAYVIDRNVAMLGVGAAMIVPLALLFPTAGGVRTWLDDELRTIDELRQFS